MPKPRRWTIRKTRPIHHEDGSVSITMDRIEGPEFDGAVHVVDPADLLDYLAMDSPIDADYDYEQGYERAVEVVREFLGYV